MSTDTPPDLPPTAVEAAVEAWHETSSSMLLDDVMRAVLTAAYPVLVRERDDAQREVRVLQASEGLREVELARDCDEARAELDDLQAAITRVTGNHDGGMSDLEALDDLDGRFTKTLEEWDGFRTELERQRPAIEAARKLVGIVSEFMNEWQVAPLLWLDELAKAEHATRQALDAVTGTPATEED